MNRLRAFCRTGWFASWLVLVAMPAAHALQPEPRMMFDATASAEIELLHARLQHAAFLLLTPEQRKQLAECRRGAAGAPLPGGCRPPPR